MTIIGRGAEAVLTMTATGVQKHRLEKKYRHPELDRKLRQFRTRREAKVLKKLKEIGFPVPKVFAVNEANMILEMEFIDGPKLRDVLDRHPEKYSEEVGRKVGILHANNIIHGDLTTSNMIVAGEIFFIDFGLSSFSDKAEDKAVDLHLLRTALESKHNEVYEEAYRMIIEGYKKGNPEWKEVLDRLDVVEKRGRNKNK